MNAQTAILQRDITPVDNDYETVSHVIERISKDYRDQPSLETLARERGLSPTACKSSSPAGRVFQPERFPPGGDDRPCAPSAR